MNTIHKNMQLYIFLDKEFREKNHGGYKYCVRDAYPVTAFRDKTALKKWLKIHGLKIGKRTWGCAVEIIGEYEVYSTMDIKEFREYQKTGYSFAGANNGRISHIIMNGKKEIRLNPNVDIYAMESEKLAHSEKYSQDYYRKFWWK